jgi:hypothetical protein
MIHNTSCKGCIFAKSVDHTDSCEFHIIDEIRNLNKEISVKEGFNYIHDYRCFYGLSQKTYDEHQSMLPSNREELKEQIKLNNQIKYYLVIYYDNSSYDIHKLCDQINQLGILPKFISIILNDNSVVKPDEIIKTFEQHLNKNIMWKVHVLVEDLDRSFALHSVLSTNMGANKSNYFWILRPEDFDTILENRSIEDINYVVNITQPICNGLKRRNETTNYYTVFLNFNNYQGMINHISQSLEQCFESEQKMEMYYYD